MYKVISAISKSLAIQVLLLLKAKKELRYSEIKKIGHYSTVSRRLRDFEKLSIVEREVVNEYPPKVVYRLTEKGNKLIEILKQVEAVFGK